jgi:hypothetical protein
MNMLGVEGGPPLFKDQNLPNLNLNINFLPRRKRSIWTQKHSINAL